uniref:Uncharacterized protein n=1 Tax=Arundo donax TaxID=35708 RepID=A0A0A8ZUC8_ARUDO
MNYLFFLGIFVEMLPRLLMSYIFQG